eukprot:gene30435-37649_t
MVTALTRFLAIEREYSLKALESDGAISLNPPIFLVGLPCTGTKVLHQLLACDPSCRTPLTWQATEPVEAMGSSEERIQHTSETHAASTKSICNQPNALATDDIENTSTSEEVATQPCECSLYLSHALHFTFTPVLNTLNILDWTQSAKTLLSQYQFHRRFVQLLVSQAESPDLPAHWVFSDPSHLHSLDVIHSVYPNAKIVWCHRKLEDQILCSVDKQFNTSVNGKMGLPDVHLMYHLSKLHKTLEAAITHRDTHDDPALFYDVYLEDLQADPVLTVSNLYAHYDMLPPSEAHILNMKQWVAAHLRPPTVRDLTLSDVGEKDIHRYHRHKEYVKRFPRVVVAEEEAEKCVEFKVEEIEVEVLV